ncbi:hypothetical protein CA13_66570 [Planctomycetes bacterium CA13]|uniref:Uncharacterized protein n=1 Tax=Novipirellula herctigrandis TaxID=2527986 RepID=A0A5C5ZDC3_9BACT|nr:hypothetical protein CA13_66570 [Planctomycetes bacterium CA13]
MVNIGGRSNASLRSKARPSKPMVTGDCSRKPSGRSVVEQRMSPEHADGRCEEARASHQEIGRSNQKNCPREWFVGHIVHRHQPQASVVTPRPNTSIPIVVDRITSRITRSPRAILHFKNHDSATRRASDGYPPSSGSGLEFTSPAFFRDKTRSNASRTLS